MTKTDQYYLLMLEQNKKLFEVFREVHDEYVRDPKKYQELFNEIGRDVQDVIRRYENMLCSGTESGGYGKFSTKLSEKWQALIVKNFPKYHSIGF
jgi:hypothetical protein